MEGRKTSLFENGLIWFGAGISIAEILTGTYFSTLGMKTGALAIILGHVIGCVMLFLAGVIGGQEQISSMESVKRSFGHFGGMFFAILNILQLAGWTAIMIYDGALAAETIVPNHILWCVIIGALIVVWLLIGITNLGKVNTVAMAALFVLTVVLCMTIFKSGAPTETITDELSFGAAVELAVSMPLSWLPVISDYTREAKAPVKASLVSTVVYGVVSCWMFFIGMGASIFTGTSDIGMIMMNAGLGIIAVLIIVFSTVTTTFLDAYSAGVSSESLYKKLSAKYIGIAVTIIGTLCAIVFPMDDITDFLYLIGSVFAPMIAIMITDYLILKRNSEGVKVDVITLAIWAAGFVIYRILMKMDCPVGNTLPCMVVTGIITGLVNGARMKIRQKHSK